MAEYIVRRLLYTLITLFAVATILFVLFRMLPGNPTAQVLSPALDEASQQRLREAFGLDKPVWEQYVIYMKNLVTFEWGRSFTSGHKVLDVIEDRLWNTLLLMGVAMCLTLTLGIAGGIVMAWRRGGPIDLAGTVTSLVFQAAPPFVTGLLLLIVLSYRLKLFPTGGMYAPGMRPDHLLELFLYSGFYERLVLPTITVGAYYLAAPLLIMRDNMLEVLGSDFIELAKAKGVRPSRVMLRHAARNALLGVVTLSSIMVGFAVGGQVVVETVFSWPGMGLLMVEAASRHDYPVAQGTFMMLAALVIVLNLVADITYSFLDPRIKVGTAQGA